jgi:S-adenosylhomocysteine hydrolase
VHAYVEHLRRRGIEPGARVVILGYGVVGRATAGALRRLGYRVEAWDKAWADEPAGRLDALADGVFPHRSRELALRRASILVSATGERGVGSGDFARLPHGAVIFNGASPGEIDPAPLIHGATTTSFLGRPLRHLQPDARSARGFSVALSAGREILVAARGDVINFGGVDPIPARYIQLTRGLLYLGALQAAGTREAGLHALAKPPQRRLVRAIRRELARGGESLSDPMF